MSRVEHFVHVLGPCPCGKGSISKSIESPDHPWGGGRVSIPGIACTTCSAEWRIFGKSLYLISSEEPLKPLEEENSRLGMELTQIGREAVDAYFAARGGTKKSEWEELKRLEMYVGSYSTYLKCRRTQPSIGMLAYWPTPTWIVANAKSDEHKARARAIVERRKELKLLLTEARKLVVKRSLFAKA
jgi:hypothetical protein